MAIVKKKKPALPARAAAPATPRREAPVMEPEAEPETGSVEEIAERLMQREEGSSPARRAAREKEEQEVLEAAAGLTPESVVRGIGDLKVTINAALDQLSQQLVDQTKKLADVQEAVAIRKRSIAEIYEVEVVAETLAALIRDYEQKKLAFAEETTARKAAFEKEMQDARGAWDKERQRFQEELAADKARAKKDWQREQEEYNYTLKTQRAREEEEYAKRRAALESELAEQRAAQEKLLGERESAVAAREKELADLQARVQAFDADLQRVAAQARDEATKAADDRARQAAALKAKDFDGTEKLLQQRIQVLEAQLAEKNERINELQSELRESTVKVRDIAVKAIEGASGAAALTHVSGIALQQAKGRDDRS